MTTSEALTGTKQYPKDNFILPMSTLDIKVEDPNDLTAFSQYHILDENGDRVDAHTIRSYCEATGATWKPLAGDTHFLYSAEMFDLYNHVGKVKALLEAYGYVLGGEDFNNPDQMAFWILEYGLLKVFLETSDLNTAPIVEE